MRLIDADALKEGIKELKRSPWYNNDINPSWQQGIKDAVHIVETLCIDEEPTVDAVSVIRCRDCKHWSADDNETYCEELGIFGTSPNSFCSFARKKEEPTMEEFMQGQDIGDPEDGSL